MFSMFRQLFASLTRFFHAFENVATSIDILSSIGKDMAEGYQQEFALEQSIKMANLKKQLTTTTK